jgi:hypothetical protein
MQREQLADLAVFVAVALSPAFEEIDAELASLSELRKRSSKVYPLASRLDAPCIQNWERLTPLVVDFHSRRHSQ